MSEYLVHSQNHLSQMTAYQDAAHRLIATGLEEDHPHVAHMKNMAQNHFNMAMEAQRMHHESRRMEVAPDESDN